MLQNISINLWGFQKVNEEEVILRGLGKLERGWLVLKGLIHFKGDFLFDWSI